MNKTIAPALRILVLFVSIFAAGCTSVPEEPARDHPAQAESPPPPTPMPKVRPETPPAARPSTPAPAAPPKAGHPGVPPPEPAPPPAPTRLVIDSESSELIILVDASGRLAREGADHVVEATRMSGEITARTPIIGSSFRLSIPVEGLQVDDARTRERLGEESVDPDQAERVRITMLNERVLDASRFPEMGIEGEVSSGELPTPTVTLWVKLHGVEQVFEELPVTVEGSAEQLVVSGRMKIRQSAFGITPLSLLAGSLKVEDELEVRFRFVGRATK